MILDVMPSELQVGDLLVEGVFRNNRIVRVVPGLLVTSVWFSNRWQLNLPEDRRYTVDRPDSPKVIEMSSI